MPSSFLAKTKAEIFLMNLAQGAESGHRAAEQPHRADAANLPAEPVQPGHGAHGDAEEAGGAAAGHPKDARGPPEADQEPEGRVLQGAGQEGQDAGGRTEGEE